MELTASLPGLDPGTVLGQAQAENFKVASRLLPRRVRGHLLAVYGFARLTDDIGDESIGDRLAQLDWLEADLARARTGGALHPIVRRLAPTIVELGLPLGPFNDLIQANRIDQSVSRYETFEDLMGYCQLSAVPVGRLVLSVFGANTPDRLADSDRVCIGLQVVEHLQDVAEDAARGRVYLPQRELRAAGVDDDSELIAGPTAPALRRVVAVQAARARRLLDSGRALATTLPLAQRVAVAGFAGGGLAALDALQDGGFDVAGVRRRPGPMSVTARMLDVLARPTTGGVA
jgi:squalene synthase HpnC